MYEKYTEITKELLDGINIGDLIKINDWKKPLRVKGRSKDYFVMATKQFGNTVYSVCEKKAWGGIRYNRMIGGMFHVGTDGWIFGSRIWSDYGFYNFDDAEATQTYLESFELPETDHNHSSISQRNAIPITEIQIKRAKVKCERK